MSEVCGSSNVYFHVILVTIGRDTSSNLHCPNLILEKENLKFERLKWTIYMS